MLEQTDSLDKSILLLEFFSVMYIQRLSLQSKLELRPGSELKSLEQAARIQQKVCMKSADKFSKNLVQSKYLTLILLFFQF